MGVVSGPYWWKIAKIFKNLTDLIIDISILDLIKFDPETYSSPVLYTDHLMEKRITLVDEVVGPNIDSTTREIAGVIIRHCQFTHLFSIWRVNRGITFARFETIN